MNLASLLLCLVFAAVGYIIHPQLLPQLIEAEVVSESALSDKYKMENMPATLTTPPVDVVEAVRSEERITDEPADQLVTPVQDQPSEGSDSEPRIQDVAVGQDSEPATANIVETMPSVDMGEPVQPEDLEPTVYVPEPTTPELAGIAMISSEDVISMMKQSVRSKEVTEFTYENAQSWASIGTKDLGDVKYQVGEVTYRARTIFGDEKLRAKALFQDGRLVKWVWPTTYADMD